MPDDSVINMLAGAWHPAVLLAVASNLKARMDGHEDPVQKRKMRDAIMTACERFVKWDAVAEYASLELEPVRLQYEESRHESSMEKPLSTVAKLDLGRRMEAQEKMSRAGTFPGKVRPTYQARI
ncbi:MAG: hypothetical protein GXY42_07155 [Desulfovibrionales bacterium]|nr:hypothetical protein [Desulfovibrionales bacterium]